MEQFQMIHSFGGPEDETSTMELPELTWKKNGAQLLESGEDAEPGDSRSPRRPVPLLC